MDIEALLFESNKEVQAAEKNEDAYDADDFEEDNGRNNSESPVDTSSILKAAATKVATEEKREAEIAFEETAAEVELDLSLTQPKKDAESILIDASREVNEYYNLQNDAEASKYEEVKENIDDVEVISTDGGNDSGEDDDQDETDPTLGKSLIFACYNDKVENTRSILKQGAYYFTRDRHGWTPLHWAASRGYTEIMEILLEHVKRKQDDGNGEKNLVKRYINAQDTITGWTALHAACVRCQVDAVQLLLKHGAQRRKLNFLKETALECIASGDSNSSAATNAKNAKIIYNLLNIKTKEIANRTVTVTDIHRRKKGDDIDLDKGNHINEEDNNFDRNHRINNNEISDEIAETKNNR